MAAGWDSCGKCGRQIPANAGGYCSSTCRAQAHLSGKKDPHPDVYSGWSRGGSDRRGGGGGGGGQKKKKKKGCSIVLLEGSGVAVGLAVVGRLTLRKLSR